MNTAQIDDYILRTVGPTWRKVAMVVGGAITTSGLGDPSADLVAERIDALVKDGLLEADGNVKDWRYSEVRRRSAPVDA